MKKDESAQVNGMKALFYIDNMIHTGYSYITTALQCIIRTEGSYDLDYPYETRSISQVEVFIRNLM